MFKTIQERFENEGCLGTRLGECALLLLLLQLLRHAYGRIYIYIYIYERAGFCLNTEVLNCGLEENSFLNITKSTLFNAHTAGRIGRRIACQHREAGAYFRRIVKS